MFEGRVGPFDKNQPEKPKHSFLADVPLRYHVDDRYFRETS
jgi:hypothetical protein